MCVCAKEKEREGAGGERPRLCDIHRCVCMHVYVSIYGTNPSAISCHAVYTYICIFVHEYVCEKERVCVGEREGERAREIV